jgi:hypothetical protein
MFTRKERNMQDLDSYIVKHGDGVTAFIGLDSTRLLHARTVYHALRACKAGMRITRTATPTRCFELASKITGKRYKRGQYEQAMADVRAWILAMESALPVVDKRKEG